MRSDIGDDLFNVKELFGIRLAVIERAVLFFILKDEGIVDSFLDQTKSDQIFKAPDFYRIALFGFGLRTHSFLFGHHLSAELFVEELFSDFSNTAFGLRRPGRVGKNRFDNGG